jgi:hypothetical protein
MANTPENATSASEEDRATRESGRDWKSESTPTDSGHSTAEGQARRNQENESPS